jgi:hypothetical protein
MSSNRSNGTRFTVMMALPTPDADGHMTNSHLQQAPICAISTVEAEYCSNFVLAGTASHPKTQHQSFL